ncbi:MAG: UDP-N-acetylglucosamine 2-epimerase (non-hydrolyzing) [Candidatus Heimdallarchaeota archaeon]|nr:UDP-N-acetylglucosamine 2-epimerase (non-hydrolyzing) [Candidatus Heimdallarchaeota archaeon]
MAPVIRKIEQSELKLTLIHSGQHYDYQMSKVFLEELHLNKVQDNLEVGSGTQAEQTAKLIQNYEKMIIKYKPDIVLALGDTNSVVATGIVCAKLNVPFGHIEAGIRSYDMTMPEEINRRLAGVAAAIHFAPTEQAVVNLYYEGINPKRIYLTGNTSVDTTLEHSVIAKKKSQIMSKLSIPKNKPLMVVTSHRPSNVDDHNNLREICQALIDLSEFSIVFSVHPRTQKNLEKSKLLSDLEKAKHIILSEPLGYLDFLMLMSESTIILTDSGGLQEEAITLGKPCVTLRTNTERPETVKLGVNFLVGADYDKITQTVRKVYKSEEIKEKLRNIKNPFGDGKASQRILDVLLKHLKQDDLKFTEPNFFTRGSADFQLIKLEMGISRDKYEEENKGQITLVYDPNGKPKPIPDKIPKDWVIRFQQF